jgi:SAM-dependent methyltransferase
MFNTGELIALDPSVRIEELPARAGTWSSNVTRRGWLCVNVALEIAAVLPPGAGMDGFVETLRTPTAVDALIDLDAHESLEWKLLERLVRFGMAHVVRDTEPRAAWRTDNKHARRHLHFVDASATVVAARCRSQHAPPVLTLVGPAPAVVAELAAARARGELALHTTTIELTEPAGPDLLEGARALGARIRYTTQPPEVDPLVPVIVRLPASADRLDEMRARAFALKSAGVSRLELAVTWPDADGDLDERAAAIYAAYEALVDQLGDVALCGLPSDAEIAQEALAETEPPVNALERAVRALHLRKRARYLADIEERYVWAQHVAAEELWTPLQQDLLPNHPELLGLGEGVILADIAGGFGRVARRLAPHVGRTGHVISVEKEPLFSSRAAAFAAELGVNQVQFRVGLCQRVPLPDASVDAVVMEWAGEIEREDLLVQGLGEMRRILRPGGRIAITYRLCNISLANLRDVFAPSPKIYVALREQIEGGGFRIVDERFWLMQPKLNDAPLTAYTERFLPRLLDDLRDRRTPAGLPSIDVTLTVVAQR